MNTGQPVLQRIDLFHKPLELRPVGEVSDETSMRRAFRANPDLRDAVVVSHFDLAYAVGAGKPGWNGFVVKEQNTHA